LITEDDINNQLKIKSATQGWDVMVAYNRDVINNLFHKKYIQQIADGTYYPAFNYDNSTYGLSCHNIILGPPTISFENSTTTDSKATIRLELISGDFTHTDTDGQVTKWESISSGDGYGLKLDIELRFGEGVVSESGDISVNLYEGTLQGVDGIDELPDEMLQELKYYLNENKISYQVGRLTNTINDFWYPISFIIRTQRYPDTGNDSQNSNGALLLFIETNYGGRGNIDLENPLWVIPDDKTASLLISEAIMTSYRVRQRSSDQLGMLNTGIITANSTAHAQELLDMDWFDDLFASNILFPENHILKFNDVKCIRDLILYGDVTERLDSLVITPDETRISAGQTIEFRAMLPAGDTVSDITWSVNGVGSINSQGIYSAPSPNEITQVHHVIVTARNDTGDIGSTLLIVLASPLEITPSFILVKEQDVPPPIEFKAIITGSEERVTWSLESDITSPGSIDNNGIYTPPSEYEYGQTIVNAVASLTSGEKKRVIICLQDKVAGRSFIAEPAFQLGVLENSSVDFSTSSLNFDADQWSIYPADGSLSEPEKSMDGMLTTWSCTYTAPASVPSKELVFVKMYSSDKTFQSGYAIVELTLKNTNEQP